MPASSTGTEVVVEGAAPIDAAVSTEAAADPSTATQENETQAGDAKATAAEPSTADEGASQPKSMLEAVKAAIEPPKTESTVDEGEAGRSPDPDGGAKDDASTKAKAEEEPPFHKHPRWQELKAKERTLDARVKELEPVAETFRQFQASVADAGLKAEEIDAGFDIMALMKSDPAKAYEKLKPYWDSLEAFMGNRLPNDLQAEVDAGSITAERAQELARAKAREGFNVERSKADAVQAERDEQAQQERALTNHLSACAAKVSEWETQWKASDPNYATKQPLVDAQLAKLNSTRGVPKTVDESVERVKEALRTVNDTLAPLTRKTAEKRTVTSGGSSAGNASPAPKDLKDAIRLAARGQYKPAA